MYWINFLHFYQPYNQQADILERVVNESYRPIIRGMKENPVAKLTININGCLTELLAKHGYQDVIDDLKKLAQRKQIEFTGSAQYHAFLPLLPETEIKRQIELNISTNQKYFGSAYQPLGFFSPELAYNKKLANIVKQMGFDWMIGEQLAWPDKRIDFSKIYQITNLSNFYFLLRDKRISVLILSATVRSAKSLTAELGNEINKQRYLLTVMDAETFGHHRPGLEKLLVDIYQDKKLNTHLVTASEAVEKLKSQQTIEPRACSWSAEEQDFWLDKEKTKTKQEHPFLLWQDPNNPIHQLQWKFTNWVISLVESIHQKEKHPKTRQLLDKALQSDQYWWASGKPWWSLEMIEQGAYLLKEVVASIPNVSDQECKKAENYYQQILSLAFKWQRQGKIRQAYRQAYQQAQENKPYRQRVYGATFNSIILEFTDEMNKALAQQEFEKAIKWRDAINKLKAGTDIYDVLHVIDDLQISRHLPSLKTFWEHTPEEFSDFAKQNFIDYSRQDFIIEQPKKLFEFIKQAFIQWQSGKSFAEVAHPLGFGWDNLNNIYLGEVPSKEIIYQLGDESWNNQSILKFSQEGKYHRPGQNFYQYQDNKVTMTLLPDSLLSKFYRFLQQQDKQHGRYLRLAVMTENMGWAPIFFSKNKRQVSFPYSSVSTGMGIKFKITGFNGREKLTIKQIVHQRLAQYLGYCDWQIRKLIWKIQG
ncbi:MAG: UvrB/UvrC motif-containing protein [Candidatus Aenigmarchaeota archaeon]|nr:UvrB/UvrC motif-containing protein [Candidatus Aenigmarchaeota archaeon]